MRDNFDKLEEQLKEQQRKQEEQQETIRLLEQEFEDPMRGGLSLDDRIYRLQITIGQHLVPMVYGMRGNFNELEEQLKEQQRKQEEQLKEQQRKQEYVDVKVLTFGMVFIAMQMLVIAIYK